jgi:hypothetical protein
MAAPHAGQRYVLTVSNNEGDAGDERLRYADADGRRFIQVMREVGDVKSENAIELQHATAPEVERAIAALERRLAREGGADDEVFLYISSHADEGQLHLAGTHLPMEKLSGFLARIRARVTLLILDSCHSGALTRTKGLRPLPGVHVDVEAPQIEGRVIISASGPDEAAQESDTLQGSYFTHHLVAALRGAADQSHDGRVTLEEAFRYAYVHTLESTYGTRGGLQHPSFHVDLHGQGDWVLTNPGGAPSRVVLSFPEAGSWVVVPQGDGMAGEFEKPPGVGVLALEPGRYRLRTKRGASLLEAAVLVPKSGEVSVGESDMVVRPLSAAAAKGGGTAWTLYAGADATQGLALTNSLLPGVQVRTDVGRLVAGVPGFVVSGGLGYRATTGAEPYQGEQDIDAFVGAGLRVDSGAWRWRAGVDLGAAYVRETQLPLQRPRNGTAPQARLALSVGRRVGGPFLLTGEVHGGAADVRTVAGQELSWSVGLGLGLGVDLQ